MKLRYTRTTEDGENRLSETIEATGDNEQSVAIVFREFYGIIITGRSGLEESFCDSQTLKAVEHR